MMIETRNFEFLVPDMPESLEECQKIFLDFRAEIDSIRRSLDLGHSRLIAYGEHVDVHTDANFNLLPILDEVLPNLDPSSNLDPNCNARTVDPLGEHLPGYDQRRLGR